MEIRLLGVSKVLTDITKNEIELEITTCATDLIPVYPFIDESSRTIPDTLDEKPNTNEENDEQFTL